MKHQPLILMTRQQKIALLRGLQKGTRNMYDVFKTRPVFNLVAFMDKPDYYEDLYGNPLTDKQLKKILKTHQIASVLVPEEMSKEYFAEKEEDAKTDEDRDKEQDEKDRQEGWDVIGESVSDENGRERFVPAPGVTEEEIKSVWPSYNPEQF